MGAVYWLSCKQCKFKFEFHKGVGFFLFSKQCNARSNMREGKWGEHWKKLIEKYPDGTATLCNALCYCKHCKKFYTEPRVEFYVSQDGYKYEDKDKKDMIPTVVIFEHYSVLEKENMICPDCKESAEVIENFSKAVCPQCGNTLRCKKLEIGIEL